jgi:hypothetical protein
LIKETKYIDENTGETSLTYKQQFDIFNESGYLLWAKKYSRKQFHDIKLSDIIGNGEDFRRIYILAEELYKDTNTIMIRVNNRYVRVADIEDISKMIGLNIRRTKEFVARMVAKQVMARRIDNVGGIVSERFLLNPLFFFCGKRLSADLYFLFQQSLDAYLPKWVIRKFHEMGNIKSDVIT